jgi:hypothetical protein
MSGTAWSEREHKILIEMATSGSTAAEIGVALRRTKDSVRSRCAAWGITLRQRKVNDEHRIRLTADLARRLQMVARERNQTATSLARELLSSTLSVCEADMRLYGGKTVVTAWRLDEFGNACREIVATKPM